MKFHRDISHILRPIVIVLGLFLLYQIWLKPTYFSPPPQPLVTEAQAPAFSSTLILSTPDNPGPSEVPQIRLIDPGDAPSVQLNQIREDLDRGNYKHVEARLRKLSKQALKTESAQHYAAALWNNLGIQQEKFGGIAISVKAFKQAVALNPKNSIALINLTQAYWGLRDPSLTPDFLQAVIRYAPNDPFPHLALADLLIERGNTAGAAEQLKLVETKAASDSNLRSYFQQLAARLPHTTAAPLPIAQQKPVPASPATLTQTMPQAPVPPPPSVKSRTATTTAPPAPQPEAPAKPFTPPGTEHFAVRFDGNAAPDAWTHIRSILEYAHQDISQKFGHTPASPIQVVLHTGQPFPAEVGTPAPADLLFDATSTTIHIPTINAMEDLALLSRVVRHEFAHAMIQEKMGAQKNALPTWLTEGLAIQLAEDPWPDLDDIKEKPGTLIALPSLQGRWEHVPKDTLAVAYFESALASQGLIDRYSMYGVRQIMNGLLAGLTFETAMQQKLSVPYQDFVRRWEEGALSAGLQKR
jgi:tetratricopeptide (TPR) repeat protein